MWSGRGGVWLLGGRFSGCLGGGGWGGGCGGVWGGWWGVWEMGGVRQEMVFSDADWGYGFTGMAVALLGRLNPVGVVVAALFFGLLRACFFALEIEAGVPSVIGMAMQGLGIILILGFAQPRVMAQVWRA